MANQSACWVCTELPLSTLACLPWRISSVSVSNWTWLQKQWNSKHPLWSATWTDIYAGAKQRYDRSKPLSGYSIWDGLGWLRAEAVELAGPAPLCIENPKGQAQAKDKTGLCQTQTLEHSWEAQDDAWAAVPPGALWVCVSHGWPYLLGNWTGCCT